MSDRELRDAYLTVAVDLPNGQQLVGKPVMYPDAMRFLAMSDEYVAQGTDIKPLIAEFHRITGISTDDPVLQDITLGELLNAMNAYFFQRRRAPVRATPAQPETPAPSA